MRGVASTVHVRVGSTHRCPPLAGSGLVLGMANTNARSCREMRDMRVSDVVQKVVLGQMTWEQAKQVLGYTDRHIRRLRRRFEDEGIACIADRRAGRVMPKKVSDETKQMVTQLRKDLYFDFNIKHFHEVVKEKHGIELSYSYVKGLLQLVGLAERAKAKGKHRRKRERRPMRGMMVHMDASRHAWLGSDMEMRDLIWVLDDADGRVLAGRFVEEEDTRTCLAALMAVVTQNGLFSELYVDRGSHFGRTAVAGGPTVEGNVQFARVCRQLNIRVIYARSPQARGRSERSFSTVQGRLPQALRAAGIRSWDKANEYLTRVFIPEFNEKFAVVPTSPDSAFIDPQGINIDRAFALEHEVCVGNDNCVRWRQHRWQIPRNDMRHSYARCRATLVEFLDGRVDIEYGQWIIARFGPDGCTSTSNGGRSAPLEPAGPKALRPAQAR